MTNQLLRNALPALTDFWRQHPALLYGVAFLLGCGIALSPSPIFILPVSLIWAPLFQKPSDRTGTLRLFFAALLLCAAVGYVKFSVKFPDMSHSKEFTGVAYYEIDRFSSAVKHYGANWRYDGKIRSFCTDEGLIAANIPATLQLSSKATPPPANQAYLIKGNLREVAPGRYALNPKQEEPWLPVNGTFSFARWRYEAKLKVGEYIQKHFSNPQSANFLKGIATGDFQDRLLTYEFGRFGLLHIMAISGFHFSIIAGILNFLLSLLFPKRQATCFLIFLLSSYFIFLGCGPSIMRAWISSILVLVSFLIERKSSGINSLGIGLLSILIFDPLLSTSIGFQFSFVATAAIFLIYPPLEIGLRKLFPQRSLSQMIVMDRASQHAYTFLNGCRHAIALTAAVNSVALPLTLYYFHKFPWLSLVYNLFFPFMVSVSMTLLLVGMLLGLLFFPLGHLIHLFNDSYTQFMLSYTYHVPRTFDVIWHVTSLPDELIVAEICIMFTVSILAYTRRQQSGENSDDWAFV